MISNKYIFNYFSNNSFTINYNAPELWGLFFQYNTTPQMKALEELHSNIMFYLAIIMFAVTWIFASETIVFFYYLKLNKSCNSYTIMMNNIYLFF
jgi:cytochrome c oxidase subunit 2